MKIVELVSMHLLVLSAFRRKTRRKRVLSLRSQCTFWCLVLSDSAKSAAGWRPGSCVSMHLLVLSAFRPGAAYRRAAAGPRSQCTFWCSVLSDRPAPTTHMRSGRSQCTFWCSVLSDGISMTRPYAKIDVSMHLLVLSAFRLWSCGIRCVVIWRLNAPSGAQCFPTWMRWDPIRVDTVGLNAPSGAQCFPTPRVLRYSTRPDTSLNAPSGAQCFPT